MSEELVPPYWRLNRITEDLKGKVKYYICSDKTTTHKKIVIEYGHQKKTK